MAICIGLVCIFGRQVSFNSLVLDWSGNHISQPSFGPGKHFSLTTIMRILKKMIKIRGLIIPDEDKKYVCEFIIVCPFTYRNIDFRDRIPLRVKLIYNPRKVKNSYI